VVRVRADVHALRATCSATVRALRGIEARVAGHIDRRVGARRIRTHVGRVAPNDVRDRITPDVSRVGRSARRTTGNEQNRDAEEQLREQ
jgi:hypothetical protein